MVSSVRLHLVWDTRQPVKPELILAVEIHLTFCCSDDRYQHIQQVAEKSGKRSVGSGPHLFILMHGELHVHVV